MLAVRPWTHPITQLTKDILDYYTYESAIISYVRETSSVFESVDQTFFAFNDVRHGGDQD